MHILYHEEQREDLYNSVFGVAEDSLKVSYSCQENREVSCKRDFSTLSERSLISQLQKDTLQGAQNMRYIKKWRRTHRETQASLPRTGAKNEDGGRNRLKVIVCYASF